MTWIFIAVKTSNFATKKKKKHEFRNEKGTEESIEIRYAVSLFQFDESKENSWPPLIGGRQGGELIRRRNEQIETVDWEKAWQS